MCLLHLLMLTTLHVSRQYTVCISLIHCMYLVNTLFLTLRQIKDFFL